MKSELSATLNDFIERNRKRRVYLHGKNGRAEPCPKIR
jgi:hypothetical protein